MKKNDWLLRIFIIYLGWNVVKNKYEKEETSKKWANEIVISCLIEQEVRQAMREESLIYTLNKNQLISSIWFQKENFDW